jgi:HrpA-like RNA helicase
VADDLDDGQTRGKAATTVWSAECKDCAAERRLNESSGKRAGRKAAGKSGAGSAFEYSGNWADREFELGHTRSDRCEFHRGHHRQAIKALAVPYVDLDVIGQVRDRSNPTGPLGGLGPLPDAHEKNEAVSDLQDYGFGMSDSDILEILSGLKDKRVAVIEAGTGSGKSTFMPFRMMNPPAGATFRPTDKGPIIVTEPRRTAATGVARFVGEDLAFGRERNKNANYIGPGFPVGYQVSGDRNWDNACELIYVTDGTMINWVRDGSLARIGMVIVDEAHERSENIDIILAQLREKICEYEHLRVVITSATIDSDFFISYFGGDEHVFHHYVPAKKSFGYGVPLFIDFALNEKNLSDGFTLTTEEEPITFPGWQGIGPEHPGFPADDLKKEAARYAELRCVKEIPIEKWQKEMPSALARQVVNIAIGTDFGDILGFLPTTKKIEEAIQEIEKGLKKNNLDFDVYPLLSSTEPAIINRAISARKRGDKRKIVISSNLAETSLTVRGVRYVVDSGLICQSQWNADLASGGLPILPHSRSGLRQRWGRVGRDAPGWVFPLYTSEQFLSLARDTPPESTRKNLEAFCMKLISAGLDVQTAVLPANFESPGFEPDQYGKEASETFQKELDRAKRALRTGGLVDVDGDLTEIGREIDRYPGEASEALAIAVSDRLACLHEVTLGIAVLCRGILYGKKDNCILRVNFDWPPEWRLRAAACHRALAAGCEDDLELALRLASLYQASENRQRWCRTWWVNEAALVAALEEVSSNIAGLSSKMKSKAERPFIPGLLSRARASIVYAFQDFQFSRDEDGVFRKVGDDVSAILPERRLADTSQHVIALNRYERTIGRDKIERHINHFVSADQSIRLGLVGEEVDSDFSLLFNLAEGSESEENATQAGQDLLAKTRNDMPIGTIAQFDFQHAPDGYTEITAVASEWEPFLVPASVLSGQVSGQENAPGFDREWDRDDTIPDEEEEARNLLHPPEQEINDDAEDGIEVTGPSESCDVPAKGAPIFARLLFDAAAPEQGGTYLVSEYVVEDEKVVALLEPYDVSRKNPDPAQHDGFGMFDELDVEFLGNAEDAYWSFIQFRVAGSHERFDVAANKFFSLDQHADTPAPNLVSGATFKVVLVAPKLRQRTISLLPYLRAQLEQAGTARQAKKGQANRLFSSVVVTDANEYGNLEVELEDHLMAGRIAPRVQVWTKRLENRGIQSVLGQRLRIGVESLPSEPIEFRSERTELEAVIRRTGGRINLKGERVTYTAPLDLEMSRRLWRLDSDEKWAVAVSSLLENSQKIRNSVVLPPIFQFSLEVSNVATELMKRGRRDFEQRYGVRLKLSEAGSAEVSGTDDTKVAEAMNALTALDSQAYAAARLPQGTTGRVIGKGGGTLRTLQEVPGIEWIWIDDEVVHIVGDTLTSVRRVLELVKPMVESVVGYVNVPGNQIGKFIGPGGEHIKSAALSSKTRNFRTENSGQWKIEGESVSALELFATLSRQYAKDVSLNITSIEKLEIIVEKRKAAEKRHATTAAMGKEPPLKQQSENRGTTKRKKTAESVVSSSRDNSDSDNDPSFLRRMRYLFWGK